MILNPNTYTLTDNNGKEHRLTRKQFDLLYILAASPDRILTPNYLIAHIWIDTIVNDNTLRVHIREIRKKFGKQIIENRHSIGYILGTEITILPCEK